MLLLGDSSTVELRTLTPSILVRIQVPQPHFYPSQIYAPAKFGFSIKFKRPFINAPSPADTTPC